MSTKNENESEQRRNGLEKGTSHNKKSEINESKENENYTAENCPRRLDLAYYYAY